MKHLRAYKLFEAKKSVVDSYLDKIGATRQDVTDVFQGIIDLGYEPKFKMTFLDKDGKSREEKTSGQETPLLLITFKNGKPGYVGGSIRFNNLDYIENLYHSLAMFMSMYKDKCNIEYDLDNIPINFIKDYLIVKDQELAATYNSNFEFSFAEK